MGLGVVGAGAQYRFMDAAPGGMSAAYMVGGGFVNWGEHMHLEATLIASGHEGAAVVSSGGLRAMQVVPLTTTAVKDDPSLGIFAGMQFSAGDYIVRPELGLYHDRSALELRRRDFIFVPAVTLQRTRRERGPRNGYDSQGVEQRRKRADKPCWRATDPWTSITCKLRKPQVRPE